jgi:hypothetical protein
MTPKQMQVNLKLTNLAEGYSQRGINCQRPSNIGEFITLLL